MLGNSKMESHAHIRCPVDSMSDKKVHISISGLECDHKYTIHACATFDNGSKFESLAVFQSSQIGCIDLASDGSLGGTYTGVDQMGIFWSMISSPDNKIQFARFMKSSVITPLPVVIKVFKSEYSSLGKIHDSVANGSVVEIQSIRINRWFMDKNTTRTELTVKKHGIHGVLFMPEGLGPFPGVIVMFGGQPGVTEYKASLLASHGFAALALGFLGEKYDLPAFLSKDPLHTAYFQKAVDHLLCQEQVGKSGVGIIAVSFSGSIALAMAECCDKVKCIIWINGLLRPLHRAIVNKRKEYLPVELLPSGQFGFESNTWRSFHPMIYDSDVATGVMQDNFRFEFQNKTHVAYMFIAGLSDDNVTSEYHINYIEKLLKHANHPNFKILRYQGAGHLIEPPYGALNKSTMFVGNMLMDWGGEALPHCRSQEHSWKEQIEFLKKNLVNTVTAKM